MYCYDSYYLRNINYPADTRHCINVGLALVQRRSCQSTWKPYLFYEWCNHSWISAPALQNALMKPRLKRSYRLRTYLFHTNWPAAKRQQNNKGWLMWMSAGNPAGKKPELSKTDCFRHWSYIGLTLGLYVRGAVNISLGDCLCTLFTRSVIGS